MKTALLFALILFAPAFADDTSPVSSQSIEEWPQAKWAMTEPQVLRAFDGAARKLPSAESNAEFNGRLGTIAIDDVLVGGVPLQALFLFDGAGKLDGIYLRPPESASPTVNQFKKIEDSLTRKYHEPLRSTDGSRFLSVWKLSRSTIELDYQRPVSLSVKFASKNWQTPGNTQSLTVVHGKHEFAEPLKLPSWLTQFPHDHDSLSIASAGSLKISYDSSSSFGSVLGHYEDVLHAASRSGITYRESGDGGGAIFRASQDRTSCSVQVRPVNSGSHVEVSCTVSQEPQSAPKITAGVVASGQTDFRQARWGMSKSEVVATETKRLSPAPDGSVFGEDTIDGLKLVFGYTFVDGKLGRAGYVLLETYAEPNQYILATDRLVKALSEKYGPPRNNSEWRNTLYRDDPLKYGLAISAGHLVIRNYWETDRTTIYQFTNGENFKVTLGIQYTGKAFESAFEQKDRDARMKAF